jgi:NADH dehydrogenase
MHLIVGGTGILGSIVAQRLLENGDAVRIMTRRPDAALELRRAGAEVVDGDLLDPASVRRACTGASAVVAAAHSLFGRGRNASQYVDGAGHRLLIDAAKAFGANHLVYTSVYDNGPAYRAVPFFRIKYQVEEYLKASGLPYTIVRPTAFMEIHAHQLIGAPVLTKGKVVMFGRGEQPRNFVAAEDVAAVMQMALKDPSLRGRTIDVGGPGNLTSMDVVRLYERARGAPAKVVNLPVGLARAAAAIFKPLHPGISQVLQAAVLADAEDQRFKAAPASVQLPMTSLETWMSQHVSVPQNVSVQ